MITLPTDDTNTTHTGSGLPAHLFAFLAGSLSGLAFVQLFGGGWLGLMVAYLSPVLLYVPGLGGGRAAAVTATVFGVLVVLLKMGGPAAAIFALMLAVPAMVISRITLARINGAWLNSGLLLQAALSLGIVLLLGTAIMLEVSGIGLETLMQSIASRYQEAMQANDTGMTAEQISQAVTMFTHVMPSLVVVSWFFVHLLGFGVAHWIVVEAKQARRTSLDLMSISLPPYVAGAFAASVIVASVTTGDICMVLGAVAALLGTGFMIVGLVILHSMIETACVRRNIGRWGRFAIYTFYYVVLMALQLPLLLALLLGLVDPWVKFRNKLNVTV